MNPKKQKRLAMANLETRAIRHMYQTEPRMFFEFAFELLHPTVEYVPCWATDVIGEALKRCAAGEIRRLVINMPPRSLKSFCASVAFEFRPRIVRRSSG